MPSLENSHENRALAALVAVALHPFGASNEVSESEALTFLENYTNLSPDEEGCVQKITLRSVLDGDKSIGPSRRTVTELAAMHREKDSESDPETEAELERKRAEIRDKIRKKRNEK